MGRLAASHPQPRCPKGFLMRRHARSAAIAVAGVVVVCASLVAVPALAGTSVPRVASGSTQGATTPAWLADLNSVRVAAGVPAVRETSAWTLGIEHHLTYLEKTDPSLRTGQYASAHTENPDSPYYTTDGALEGSRSNLVRNYDAYPGGAVDSWWTAPFHAIGMLRAGLSSVGYAEDGHWAGMDIISGLNTGLTSSKPILFPGAGSTTYLTTYGGNESPDPIETCRKAKGSVDYGKPGLPLIAMLSAAPDSRLTATLTSPTGTTTSSSGSDLCIVDETTYTSSDAVYGATGKQILTGDHAVLLVPRTALVAGNYTARISQPKQSDIAWSFTVDPTQKPGTTPTTSPTTTAPTTTAPTTTAPTTSAPAPVALSPVVTTSATTCSYGARAGGSVTLAVGNPADGTGPATYTVTVDGSQVVSDSVTDGATTELRVGGLPPGSSTAGISGSDGSATEVDVAVPTCPRYQGVRVGIRVLTHRHVRVTLDNRRNAGATRFRIEAGHQAYRRTVAAQASDRLRIQVARRTSTIRVYVGGHRVARVRLHR